MSTAGRVSAWMRTTAMSVSGSRPTTLAAWVSPSGRMTRQAVPPSTTWLLVTMKPSGVSTKPDPLPP